MIEFQELMRMSIMVAMPQTFVYLLFILSFLQPQPQKLMKRLAILAVFHSLYTDTLQLILPLPLHLINSIFAQIVLIWWLFRDLSHKQKIGIFVFANLFYISMDLISNIIAQYGLGITDREEMYFKQFFRILPVLHTQTLLVLIASWFIRRRNMMAHNRYFSILVEGGRSSISKIILLIFFQFLLLSALPVVQFAGEKNGALTTTIIYYLVIAVSLTALVFIFKFVIHSRQQAVKSTQDVYVEDINRMFSSIRGQRHDFINHLQVIHSFTQMGKTAGLQRYVADLVQETREMSEIVNHGNPALAAFVQAKTAVAVAKGIAFTFELPATPYADDDSIRTIDMIKILGNLVDNAFDEVMSLPLGARLVHASVRYEEGKIVMEVTNRGKVLGREEREKIFAVGYTTKKDGKHAGLGLAIVSERTKHYGGTLELQSDERNGTAFRISIPLSKKEAATG